MPSPPDQPDGTDDPRADRFGPADVDFAAVARISTQAELKDIRLSFLHADWTERAGPIPRDWTTNAVMGFSTDAFLDRASKVLTVECGFIAVYAPDQEGGALPNPKDAPLELHARFELTYELRDIAAIEDADPDHFALANGVLHAWPYWREIAQTTTVRMGFAPLLVGTVKIPWSGDPDRQGQQTDPPDAAPPSVF
jgi:hypothetical protein